LEFNSLRYHGSEHDHDYLWIKDVSIHGIYIDKEIEKIHFMWCFIITNYITKFTTTSTQLNTKEKKNHVVFIFHYSLPPMSTTKMLHLVEWKENLPFSKKNLQQQTIMFFILKKIKTNEKLHSLNFKTPTSRWRYIHIKLKE